MLIILLFLLLLFTFRWSIKDTIFDISLKNTTLSGVFIAQEIFLLVVLGVFLFEFYGLDKFYTFYMTEESMHNTSIIILLTLIALFIFIKLFSKLFFAKYLMTDKSHTQTIYPYKSSLISSILLLIILLMIIFTLAGLRHSFIGSISGQGELIDLRLANRNSGIPTVLFSFFSFLNTVLSCVVGYYFNRIRKYYAYSLTFLIIIFSSFFGGKGPVINTLLLLIVAIVSSRGPIKINPTSVVKLLITSIAGLFIIYQVVKVQFPEFDDSMLWMYFVNRIGVGQIHGAYEQFALQLHNKEYILHTIPFANFFFEYTPYNKDLMMHTWGLGLTDKTETGVMNSLFIGEALAIGGFTLVALSPLIVAFNYCFTIVLIVSFLHKNFKLPKYDAQKISALIGISFLAFTGDITGLLFLKSFFMILFFLTAIFISFITIRSIKVRL